MKVSREQVQQHRERILAAASHLFRERGFDGVSVADVMKAAGLTHGGFYGHFDSKDALISEALVYESPGRRGRTDTESAAEYADAYLSTRHRDNRGTGCAIAGVGSEAARASADVRTALTKAIRRQIDRSIQRGLARHNASITPTCCHRSLFSYGWSRSPCAHRG
jgi:TetR/AcrR family transcriptional regulator, transcriptional repressor for nem operon